MAAKWPGLQDQAPPFIMYDNAHSMLGGTALITLSILQHSANPQKGQLKDNINTVLCPS